MSSHILGSSNLDRDAPLISTHELDHHSRWVIVHEMWLAWTINKEFMHAYINNMDPLQSPASTKNGGKPQIWMQAHTQQVPVRTQGSCSFARRIRPKILSTREKALPQLVGSLLQNIKIKIKILSQSSLQLQSISDSNLNPTEVAIQKYIKHKYNY